MADLSVSVAYDTIRSLTHPKVAQKISDNITGKIPLFYFYQKSGNKEYENGGDEYQFPVLTDLSSGQWYTGLTPLDVPELDAVKIARYQRKLYTVPIVLTGEKLLKNSGKGDTAVVNYIMAQVEIAIESMKSGLAGSTNGLFSSNGDSDTGLTGLQTFLTDSTSTGTVGGLSRATYSFWRHQRQECGTGFNTSGLVSFRALHINIARGDEGPTVIVVTPTTYANLDRALTGTLTFNNPSPKTAFGDIGFEHISFHGAPVIADDGVPANRAYFINMKYMKLVVNQDRDMSIRDFITPINQDGLFGRLYFAGNQVCTNLARQGQIYGLPDTWA